MCYNTLKLNIFHTKCRRYRLGVVGEKGTRLESVTITVAVYIECFYVCRWKPVIGKLSRQNIKMQRFIFIWYESEDLLWYYSVREWFFGVHKKQCSFCVFFCILIVVSSQENSAVVIFYNKKIATAFLYIKNKRKEEKNEQKNFINAFSTYNDY